MTTRPDRPPTPIDLAFISHETAALIGLRFGKSSSAIYSAWKRAKRAGRLPKLPRRIAIKRNRA